jgi:ubiquinol-cytochrome c reductase cytochrome b subunit
LWGGFSVSGVTLSRFFVLHFLLPFVILGLVGLHIGLVHIKGSSTSNLFCTDSVDFITFYPYFILKDFFYFLIFFFFFCHFVFFEPNALGHPDNYIRANPLSTPAHIVPEWYFLPFYAILRCVPDKLGGIVLMFGAIFILFFLPILTDSEVFKNKKQTLFLVNEGFIYDTMFVF